ncbi:MAG: hypothetical protein ACJ76I_11805 [Gaiellaceae bacterium]
MRLSASEVDWSRLSERARWALEHVLPLQNNGYKVEEIAEQLGVGREEVTAAHELLEAETLKLFGHIVLPNHTEEEFESLKAAIAAYGQIYPILYGSDGVLVDGRGRLRACNQLKIAPKKLTLELPSDQLRALALAVNVARRHLPASARRGIARATLLLDPTRSDRAIAADAGVSHPTVAAVRKELEKKGLVEKSSTRVGADGVAQSAKEREPQPEPTHVTVRVKVAVDRKDQLLGRWVDCKAFRLVEVRHNVYELQVQLLENVAASGDAQADVAGQADALDALLGFDQGTSIAQLLGDATEIFGRPIGTVADLTVDEASWCQKRLVELDAAVAA